MGNLMAKMKGVEFMTIMKKICSLLTTVALFFMLVSSCIGSFAKANEDTAFCACPGWNENSEITPDIIINADDATIYTEDVINLPSAVDNSTSLYFPIIGNQGSKGSCSFFSVVYYQFTYEKNRLNNTYARTAEGELIEENVASPDHLFNLICYNNNEGGYPGIGCANALKNYGSASLAEIPYNESISTVFPENDAMRRALNTRVSNIIEYVVDTTSFEKSITSPSSERLNEIKSAINEGHIFSVNMYARDDCWSIKEIENSNDLIIYRCSSPSSGSVYHALTIVGYDDTIWCDINGDNVAQSAEYGAFKIANSWGESWGNAGFIWVAYDALNTYSAVSNWAEPLSNRVAAFGSSGRNSFLGIEVSNYSPKFILEIQTTTSWFSRHVSLVRYSEEDNTLTAITIPQVGEVILQEGEIGTLDYTMFLDYDSLCEPFDEFYTGYSWGFESTKPQINVVTAASIVDNLGNTIQQFDIFLSDQQYGMYMGQEEINLTFGDINYDGILNQLDVNSIIRYTIGAELFSNTQYEIADMNRNGIIESADARILTGLIGSDSADEVSFEELYAQIYSETAMVYDDR